MVAGPLHILLAYKKGRIWVNILCLKLYQFERTTWWCLSALGIYSGSCYGIYPKICHVVKNITKIMISQNLHLAHLLEVGLKNSPGDHETLSIVRHVGLHVEDFSSMKSSLGLRAFTSFVCEVNTDGLRPSNQ